MKNKPAFFEDHEIRRIYDEETEIWWFSVIDIIQVLTQQAYYQTARKYWNKLKERLGKEGSQLVTSCHQLKMTAQDGKQRLTDAATGMEENKQAATKGGAIAKQARQALESKTGKAVVSDESFLPPGKAIKKVVESHE